MFKKAIIASLTMLSSAAYSADFEFGTYAGLDQNGDTCEVTFGSPAGYVNNYPGAVQGRVSLVRVQVFGQDYMILDRATLGPVYQSTERFDRTPSGTHLEVDLASQEAFVFGNGVNKRCYF